MFKNGAQLDDFNRDGVLDLRILGSAMITWGQAVNTDTYIYYSWNKDRFVLMQGPDGNDGKFEFTGKYMRSGSSWSLSDGIFSYTDFQSKNGKLLIVEKNYSVDIAEMKPYQAKRYPKSYRFGDNLYFKEIYHNGKFVKKQVYDINAE